MLKNEQMDDEHMEHRLTKAPLCAGPPSKNVSPSSSPSPLPNILDKKYIDVPIPKTSLAELNAPCFAPFDPDVVRGVF